MAAYRQVDDLPAGWLLVHWDQLQIQHSVTSMGNLYLFPAITITVKHVATFVCLFVGRFLP